jgi:uncharacterized protein (TIGR02001 family)
VPPFPLALRRPQRKPAVCAIALLAWLMLPPAALGAEGHAAVGLASDYVVHGISRSLGDAVAQGSFGVSWRNGSSVGLWASTANLNPGRGATQEYAPYLAHRFALYPDVTLDLQLSRYLYPHDLAFLRYDYTELRAALSWRDLLEVVWAGTPDFSVFTSRGVGRDRFMWRTEVASRYPFGAHLSMNLGVGYAGMQELVGTGYWYGSLGVAWRWRTLTASVALIETDDTARRLFSDARAGSRVAGALIWQWR